MPSSPLPLRLTVLGHIFMKLKFTKEQWAANVLLWLHATTADCCSLECLSVRCAKATRITHTHTQRTRGKQNIITIATATAQVNTIEQSWLRRRRQWWWWEARAYTHIRPTITNNTKIQRHTNNDDLKTLLARLCYPLSELSIRCQSIIIIFRWFWPWLLLCLLSLSLRSHRVILLMMCAALLSHLGNLLVHCISTNNECRRMRLHMKWDYYSTH